MNHLWMKDMTIGEAKARLAEILGKIENPPATLIPAALPILEAEAEEISAFLKYEEDARELLNMISIDGLVNYMDCEIREEVHAALAPCDEVSFLAAYLEKHFQKYGELLKV